MSKYDKNILHNCLLFVIFAHVSVLFISCTLLQIGENYEY